MHTPYSKAIFLTIFFSSTFTVESNFGNDRLEEQKKRLREDPQGKLYDYQDKPGIQYPTDWGTPQPTQQFPQSSEVVQQIKYMDFTLKPYSDALHSLTITQIEQLIEMCPEELKREIECLESFASKRYRFYTPKALALANRILLVGPPGSGKSSLALAIAYKTKRRYLFVSAASLANEFKNSSISILDQLFDPLIQTSEPTVVIFDEITAFTDKFGMATNPDPGAVEHFWIKLDLCRHNPHLLIIFTTNSTKKLPETIQDRFAGYHFTIPAPRQAFRDEIFRRSFTYRADVDSSFLAYLSKKTRSLSLREINSIVKHAEKNALYRQVQEETIDIALLEPTKEDIQKALNTVLKEHAQKKWDTTIEQTKTLLREAGPYVVPVIGLVTGLYFQYQSYIYQTVSLTQASSPR